MQLIPAIIQYQGEKFYYIEDFDSLSLNSYYGLYYNLLSLIELSNKEFENELKKYNGKYHQSLQKFIFPTFKDAKNAIDKIEERILIFKLAKVV